MHGVEKDHAPQVFEQFFLALSGQFSHVLHIHLCFFPDGQGQRLRRGIDARNGSVLFDGAFGEKIRLALHLSVVHHFQRTQQIIGIVRGKSQGVAPAVDDSVFFRVGVVELV